MGQKAAKAVTAGTKWFMKAGRSLVKEVTAKLDKHRPDGAGGGSSGCGAQSECRARPLVLVLLLGLGVCPELPSMR